MLLLEHHQSWTCESFEVSLTNMTNQLSRFDTLAPFPPFLSDWFLGNESHSEAVTRGKKRLKRLPCKGFRSKILGVRRSPNIAAFEQFLQNPAGAHVAQNG